MGEQEPGKPGYLSFSGEIGNARNWRPRPCLEEQGQAVKPKLGPGWREEEEQALPAAPPEPDQHPLSLHCKVAPAVLGRSSYVGGAARQWAEHREEAAPEPETRLPHLALSPRRTAGP